MSADTPCCPIGRRHDVADIDAAVRQVGQPGAPSLGALAGRYGVAKSSLSVHRSRCLGLAAMASPAPRGAAVEEPEAVESSSPPPAVQATAPTPAAPSEHPPSIAEQRSGRRSENPPTNTYTAHASQVPSPHQQSARRLPEATREAPRRDPLASAEDAQRVSAERIRSISTLIANGSWKGEAHVAGLAQRWGVEEAAVRRLHGLAALRVKSDRGTLTAQREEAVARVKGIIREELDAAKMYDQGAKEALEQAMSAHRGSKAFGAAPARWCKSLAAMCRATALQAEKFLATITYQRPKDPATLVNVTYSAQPDFGAAWQKTAEIVEALFGAAGRERMEQAFAAWEDRGDVGLAEWMHDQVGAGALLLERQTDGSYGEPGSEAVA